MRGNVHVRFGGRGRRNGVREIEPPRSAPTLLKQLPKRSGECLFEIILRRYETKSTMMTSNRPLEDWGKLWGTSPRPRLSWTGSSIMPRSSRSPAAATG
jgi:hypothetical protein